MTSSPDPDLDSKVHTRVRQQEVVAELGQQALETDGLDQLMHDAAAAVAETLNVEYAKVFELLPGGDEVFLRQGVGWRDGLVGNVRVPTHFDSQAGYTLNSEEPIIVSDINTTERFSGPELLTSHDVVSGISVIIGSVEDPWGILGVHTTERREFTNHDANFVQSVANVLASAIANRETQNELKEMHSRISDAFYSLNENWEFTYLNDRAEELIDITGEGLVGKDVWDTFEWAADSKPRMEYEQAMETQESTSFEFYYPDPLDAWFEVNAYPSETGLSVYFRDITERKVREAEFRMVVENIEETIWITAPDTMEYQYISPSFDDIWGISRQRLYDDPGAYVQWVHPEDRERVRTNFNKLPDEPFDETFRVVRPDEETRWLRIRGKHVENDEGIARVIGIGQDITERKVYERELEKSNERLEQFAYAASHDLQEPLRMVSSYLQLIESRYADDFDDDGEEFLEFAVDGAERMREMIDALLEYSRVDTQGDPLEPVDLNRLLEDVQKDLQMQIEESNTTLTTDDLPWVKGDDNQLRQVFQNLLSNAITYSGDGLPKIHVEANRQGRMWKISVHDEGIGIDPDQQDRVFEVFQRLHGREEHSGTGIGLALCRRIIERHGGEIWVESKSGGGATFSFTLPPTDT
ncbi:PAS domain S-box protein [Haloterrigena sp. H1]|uniref:ATP-binding protein n=1 Tax=Haloterrigena sp. H1 TaxID=2552943 RepID=UPI00110F5C5D|nr:ATP-binding protein [Haloterrigena sp. H1]TMT81600.1 PAS domain S-box protein [Haloterrigena sp. H1]